MNDDYQQRIADWFNERQQLLVAIFEIHQIPPENLKTKTNKDKLTSFCQCLIDYISAGHFEIYHRLMETLEGQNPVALDQVHTLLNSIQDSTDIAVSFNDQYDLSAKGAIDSLFRQRLSDLAESLAERFEMEDLLFDQCRLEVNKSLSA